MDFSNIVYKKAEIDEAIRLIELKKIIAEYYAELAEQALEFELERYYRRKSEAMKMCHASWIFNHYKKYGYKDFQYVLHCHDKFCPICQKLLARSREIKFKPVLDRLANDYDIYHLTLTSPNESGIALSGAVKRYARNAQKLFRYLSGRAKIKGVDFSKYGYQGALRSLEIVPNINYNNSYKLPDGGRLYFGGGVKADYHIHYHSLLVLKKDLKLKQYIVNEFSENKRDEELYYFSELEILIQDIWYLLCNNIKVTKEAIDNLKLGYSCRCTLISDGGYHQVFKYITKTQDAGSAIPLEVFQTLESATKNKRVIQGFGCFYGLGIEDEKLDEDFDPVYDKFITFLNALCDYEQISETPYKIRDNITEQTSIYFSRKKYRGYLLDTDDNSDIDLPDFLKPLPKDLAIKLLQAAEQMSFNFEADLKVKSNKQTELSCFDGGYGRKPKY